MQDKEEMEGAPAVRGSHWRANDAAHRHGVLSGFRTAALHHSFCCSSSRVSHADSSDYLRELFLVASCSPFIYQHGVCSAQALVWDKKFKVRELISLLYNETKKKKESKISFIISSHMWSCMPGMPRNSLRTFRPPSLSSWSLGCHSISLANLHPPRHQRQVCITGFLCLHRIHCTPIWFCVHCQSYSHSAKCLVYRCASVYKCNRWDMSALGHEAMHLQISSAQQKQSLEDLEQDHISRRGTDAANNTKP